MVPRSDSIVCIGCDSHYGPNRHLLETSFERPYKLFLEYPSEYVHNAAFKKMMGYGTFPDFIFMFSIYSSFSVKYYNNYLTFSMYVYLLIFLSILLLLFISGNGESMTFIKKFQPLTNETQYTKRVMKIIEYAPI